MRSSHFDFPLNRVPASEPIWNQQILGRARDSKKALERVSLKQQASPDRIARLTWGFWLERNDFESAILHTVGPGTYPAIVRGKHNGTNVTVVEIYNLQ